MLHLYRASREVRVQEHREEVDAFVGGVADVLQQDSKIIDVVSR